MGSLKIATFNVEWMYSIFNGDWKNWDGKIRKSFPGKSIGGIRLEPIEDVHGLCRRIAGVIRRVEPLILGIQEGPPRRDQMQLFVEKFLDGDYIVHSSNERSQALHFLVHRSIADNVESFAHDGPETEPLRAAIRFYPWGKIASGDAARHKFDRRPLVLTFKSGGARLRIVNVHTKSKYSKLKTPEQWEERDPEAINDALLVRQKLSAEIARLRQYLVQDLTNGAGAPDGTVVVGDFNDGAYAELIEREFLIHNIIDELVGSFLEPTTYFKHAMSPAAIAKSATVQFPDPLEGGKLVEELIDHVLVSPSIWQEGGRFRIKSNSCVVEMAAYKEFDQTDKKRKRGDRPSDHRPVSVIVEH